MKELSIEEKARNYDEAYKKIAIRFGSNVADEIFSQFEMSENERMRNAAINACKYMVDNFENSTKQYEDAIAWLEKQGETFTKRDIVGAYMKGVTNTKNEIEKQYEANYQIRKDIATFIFNYKGDIKDRAKWMDYLGIKVSYVEKQGDQKPNPCDGCVNRKGCINCENGELRETEQKPALVEPKFKVGDKIISTISNIPYYITEVCNGHYLTDVGCIIMFNAQNNFKLVEQKPAWSEKDETALGDALWCCKQAASIAKDENDMGNVWYAETWLESLKGRVQPKQEWSEDDERIIMEIISDLDYCKAIYTDDKYESVDNEINWLKSLKPQSQWKPSEEQINYFSKHIEYERKWNSYHALNVLSELLEQLKKLKGE